MVMNQEPGTRTKKNGPGRKPDADRRRLQLDFTPDAYRRLLEIHDKSNAASNAEVVRNALRLHEWFLDQKLKGARVQVVEGDTVKEVELLI